MTGRSRRSLVAIALAVAVLGTIFTVGVAAEPTAGDQATLQPGEYEQQNGTDNETDALNVTVGAQLSTVIETQSNEVRADVADARFTVEYERGDRAAAVDERAAELRAEARTLRERYRNATDAYHDGELTREEYGQRIATIHDDAERLRDSLRQLWDRADDLDPEVRKSVDVNRTAIRRISDELDDIEGAGPRALLARFTGHDGGELEIRLEDGIRVEAESDEGERSREIRRLGDHSLDVTIGNETAREAAHDALSTDAGNWSLEESSVHEFSGFYRFEYFLDAANLTGDAEVRVDGSNGEVLRLEEEIEPGNGTEDSDDADHWLDPDDRWDDDRERNESERGWFGDQDRDGHPWSDDGHWGDWDDDRSDEATDDDTEASDDDTEATDDGAKEDASDDDGTGDSQPEDGEDDETAGNETKMETDAGGNETEDVGDRDSSNETDSEDVASGDGLTLEVTNGTVQPGETVTVSVTVDGNLTADVPIEVDGDVVGTTTDDGTVQLTVPETDDVRIEADTGDADVELRYEFEAVETDDGDGTDD